MTPALLRSTQSGSFSIFASLLFCSALLDLAQSCSIPPGGCVPSNCERLRTLPPQVFRANNGNTRDPAIGRYAGGFNWYWNTTGNFGAEWESVRGGPYVNWEVFPSVETRFLIPSSEAPTVTNLGECCSLCARTANCTVYQFFTSRTISAIPGIMGNVPTVAPQGFNSNQQCYLLSGGSVIGDREPFGTPFSGPKNLQIGANQNIAPSWVGGFCNPNSTVDDDPHFVGALGTKYDFNGAVGRVFNLLSDKNIHINILLGGYLDSRTVGATVLRDGKAIRTWIKEVGVVWRDNEGQQHTAAVVSRSGKDSSRGTGFISSVRLDNEMYPVPSKASPETTKGLFTLRFLGTGTVANLDMEEFRLKIDGQIDVVLKLRAAHPLLQTMDDAFVHFNVHINEFHPSDQVHGVLGQTFRNSGRQYLKALEYQMLTRLIGGPIAADGASGKGFLEGEPKDYEMESLVSTKGKFSSF